MYFGGLYDTCETFAVLPIQQLTVNIFGGFIVLKSPFGGGDGWILSVHKMEDASEAFTFIVCDQRLGANVASSRVKVLQ